MSDFAIRVRIHNEDGTPGRILKTTNIEVSEALNSPGSIRFTTSERFGGAISAPFVVGVEYSSSNSPYASPRNNLYIVFNDDSDTVDPTGTRTFGGIGYIPWLLMKLILETSSTAKNGKRKFTDSYPARPLRAMILEGQDRGWAPWVSMDWSSSTDSIGSSWTSADDETQSFPLGITAWQVLESAVEEGLYDWWTEGTTLRVKRNPLGVDRTESVRLGGPGYVRAPVTSDASEIITNLYITGDELKRPVRVANEGATTRFGRLEGSMTVSGVEKSESAIRRAKPTLADTRSVKREMSYEWVPRRELRRPWVHFRVGDDVTARMRGDSWTAVRVIRIQVSQTGDKVSANITVGQKIRSKSTKTSRRASAVSTGTVVGGSGLIVPSAKPSPSTEPLPPAGFAVLSNEGYFSEDGTARARVELGWSDVIAATDGTEIDVVAYEVHYKPTSAAGWRATRVTGNVCAFDTWLSGVEYRAKVRALSDEGVWSEFNPELVVTPGVPTSVPDAPSAPMVSTKLGTVTVSWDGALTSGAPQAGWSNIYVEVAKDEPSPTWKVIGDLKRGGVTFPASVVGASIGDSVLARLTAVNTIGLESAKSATTSIVVAGIVGPDMEFGSVGTNQLEAGAVRAQHMAVGVDETGQRVEITGQGVRVYDTEGNAVVSIGTSTDDFLSVSQKSAGGDLVTVAQIDEAGEASFESLVLSSDAQFQGVQLIGSLASDPMNGFDMGDIPLLDRFGRGLVAVARIGSPNVSGALTYAGLAIGSVNLLKSRVYQVRVVGPTAQSWTSDGGSGNLYIQCYVGTGAQGITSSNTTNGAVASSVVLRSNAATGTGVQESFVFTAFSPGVDGEFNLMIRLWNESNRSFSFTPDLVNSNPTRVEVWDVGAAAAQWDTESWQTRATSGTVTPPASKKTLEVAATWSTLWGPSGSIRPSSSSLYDDGRMVQGGNTSLGNGRAGQIGFPALGLAGKTPLGMWVLLRNRHTSNSSATVDIGTHGNSSAPSGSSPNNVNTFTRKFARGETRWVPIPSGLWAGFMSGAYRGIQIGGPNVNSGSSDYGIFDGYSTTNAAGTGGKRPRLKVSYK